MAVLSVICCRICYHCDLCYNSLQTWINRPPYKYT